MNSPTGNHRYPGLPVVGIAGPPASGKTLLIEEALARLVRRGLRVAVLHSSAQPLSNEGGQATERLLEAGARSVTLYGPETGVRSRAEILELSETLRKVPADTDIVLVAGYEPAWAPKLWLKGPDETPPPPLTELSRVLAWKDPENPEHLVRVAEGEMRRLLNMRRLFGGILGGGQSRRMGKPKALLYCGSRTFYRCVYDAISSKVVQVVTLGAGCYPEPAPAIVLPDAPGLRGPLAGILSAGRWAPDVAWLICGVDMPQVTEEAVDWVLKNREPGFWAVIPRIPGRAGVEPLLACYEPMIFPLLEARASEDVFSLQDLARHPKVKSPTVPEELVRAFTNVNTPDEAARLVGSDEGSPQEGRNIGKLLEHHLERIQKTDTMARLIPGFVHSLNNELTAILCAEKMIEHTHPDDPDLMAQIQAIREALRHGAEATRSILFFCRASAEPSVLNLVERLRVSVTLLRYVVGRRIEIQLDMDREAIPVRGDPQALLHVFVAVGQNAAEAMPEGGRLRVAADILTDEPAGLAMGRVLFTDDGPGLPAVPAGRVFEPLFTTKSDSEHLGLGLTVARKIIEAHQGRITVAGRPGKGTRVSVCVPLSDV